MDARLVWIHGKGISQNGGITIITNSGTMSGGSRWSSAGGGAQSEGAEGSDGYNRRAGG